MTRRASKGKPRPARQSRRKKKQEQEVPLSSLLLSFLHQQRGPVALRSILGGLALTEPDRKAVKEALAALEKAGRVRRSHHHWQTTERNEQLRATLSLTAKGFGFAILEGNIAKQQKDIFIPAAALNGATHGDTVLIRLNSRSSAERPEGEVVAIEKRAFTHVCGIYMSGRGTGYLTPDNDRLPFSVTVRRSDDMRADDGMAVRAELLDCGNSRRLPQGRIVEILGPPDAVQVQLRLAIEQFSLPRSFPAEVEAEAAALAPLTEAEGGRKDLRHIRHVTIDGATAKDFDDAIAVQKTQHGFRLFVSIADVSHYVRPDSALDREAYQRGTSVYLPNMVLPMLPERLSNDLCSLVPDQDRPAFTAILDFDQAGKRVGEKFGKSLIRSQKRLTYDTVNQAIYLREKTARQEHKSLLPMLEKAKELAALLAEQRTRRGALGFAIPEAEIALAGDAVCAVGRLKRNQAHLLIEEFMLAANEAVAEVLDRSGAAVLFRVHETPDPVKVEEFADLAGSLGLKLPKTEIMPSWFAEALAAAKDTPAEYVVNNLLLRTMQRARYTPQNLGHFGLAAQYYLHFTSPIRRYPDLVAHRALHNLLTGSKAKILPGAATLEEAGAFLSSRERTAVDVERNVQARLSALFLRGRILEEFDAVISGVTAFGLFAELVDCFISGAIPVKDMQDDYYRYDGRRHKLVGERTGKVYRLGDLIRVRLEQVDLLAKKITFALAEGAAE